MISFIRNHVFHNVGLKLLSIAIAIGVWLAVVRDPQSEIVLNVPVQFERVPGNLELTSEHIPQAEIRVRGPERTLRDLDQADVHVSLDLTHAAPGEHTYDLNVRNVRVPRNVEVVQVIPAQMRINFDRDASRMIAVKPRVIGTFAPGMQLAEVTSDPPQVTIVGPEKRVAQIEALLTDPVDATGVVGAATFVTNIYVPDPLVRLVRPAPVHVTVVTEKSGKK